MLNVYKCMSENISAAIAANGESVTKQPLIRSMRTVKKETLKLISGWVSMSTDPQMVRKISEIKQKSVIKQRLLLWNIKAYESLLILPPTSISIRVYTKQP